MRLLGRSEDQQALRDTWHLRQPGCEAGPAGDVLAAWKYLADASPQMIEQGSEQGIVNLTDTRLPEQIAVQLGVRWSDELSHIPNWMDALRQAKKPAPFAMADIIAQIHKARPDARLLAFWYGDLVLAKEMHWPTAVPLITGRSQSSAFRYAGDRGRILPGEPAFERAICLALAEACTAACQMAADMARRADRLIQVAPKLRAKGAGEAIQRLLDDDAVSGSLQTKHLTRWGARRLFERLIAQDAIRELSGRTSFRLYGI
jgi:hypothetical protein